MPNTEYDFFSVEYCGINDKFVIDNENLSFLSSKRRIKYFKTDNQFPL